MLNLATEHFMKYPPSPRVYHMVPSEFLYTNEPYDNEQLLSLDKSTCMHATKLLVLFWNKIDYWAIE